MEPSQGDSQQGEACSYRGSPPIKQVLASQIRLIFLITANLASSQDQGVGGGFDSSWGRNSKPERTPAKQVMVHGRISDPGGGVVHSGVKVLCKKEATVEAQP